MLPSLTSLSIGTLNTSKTPTSSKRARSGAGSIEQSDRLQTLLSDLLPEIQNLVLLALAKNDCRSLQNICRVSGQFADICRNDRFWQTVLLTKGWAPDWSPIESPGGMTPKAYYRMICEMNYAYRTALLDLSLETTVIQTSAFSGCTSLALTHLPNAVTTIGDYAFEDCMSLALTHLPNTVTTIGDLAFSNCTSLALTHLPDTLTTIGVSAFSNCTSLALTHLPNTLITIKRSTFDGCTSLALTHLPNTVTTIGDYAFLGCTQLRGGEFEAEVRRANPKAF